MFGLGFFCGCKDIFSSALTEPIAGVVWCQLLPSYTCTGCYVSRRLSRWGLRMGFNACMHAHWAPAPSFPSLLLSSPPCLGGQTAGFRTGIKACLTASPLAPCQKRAFLPSYEVSVLALKSLEQIPRANLSGGSRECCSISSYFSSLVLLFFQVLMQNRRGKHERRKNKYLTAHRKESSVLCKLSVCLASPFFLPGYLRRTLLKD